MSHHMLRQSLPAIPRPSGMSAKTQAGTYLASGRCRWPLRGAEVGSSGPAGYVCSSGYQNRTYTSQLQVGPAEWWQGSPGDGNTLRRRRRVGIEPERSSQSSIQKYIHKSTHPLIHPSRYDPWIHPAIHPFILPSNHTSMNPCMHHSIYPSIIHSSIHVIIHPWICVSSIHPLLHLSQDNLRCLAGRNSSEREDMGEHSSAVSSLSFRVSPKSQFLRA